MPYGLVADAAYPGGFRLAMTPEEDAEDLADTLDDLMPSAADVARLAAGMTPADAALFEEAAELLSEAAIRLRLLT